MAVQEVGSVLGIVMGNKKMLICTRTTREYWDSRCDPNCEEKT